MSDRPGGENSNRRALPETKKNEEIPFDLPRSEILRERARKYVAERQVEAATLSGPNTRASAPSSATECSGGQEGAVSRFRAEATKVAILGSEDSSEVVDLITIHNVGDS